MRVTERNDSEKVADRERFDVSASRGDCTHDGDGCRECTQTANPSRAAEPMLHSRGTLARFLLMDKARPRTVIATDVENQPTRPPSVPFKQQSVTYRVVRQVT